MDIYQMQHLVPNYKRATKNTTYTPKPDGFVCSVGNKELIQKYGNKPQLPGITTVDLYNSIVRK